jgi:hypothetical protein
MDAYDDEDDTRDILELDNEDDNMEDDGDVLPGMEVGHFLSIFYAHRLHRISSQIVDDGNRALAYEDEDDEDQEDDEILPSDSLLLLAMTEDEYSHLEVQVLTEDGGLYTHHDILLPDFPLSLAWMDCPPYAQG